MKIYGYTVPAGGSQLIHRPGIYIRGISAALPYEIQLDDGPATGFETGLAYEAPEQFNFVRINNTADTAQFIEVAISYGEVSDNRLVGGSIAPKPGELIQAVGDINGGGTIPSNPDRRQLIMRAGTGNSAPVRIAGLPLDPGDVFELDVTGSLAVTGDPLDVLHVAEVI